MNRCNDSVPIQQITQSFLLFLNTQWKDHVHIYTDGSVKQDPRSSAYGLYVDQRDISECGYISPLSSIFSAVVRHL